MGRNSGKPSVSARSIRARRIAVLILTASALGAHPVSALAQTQPAAEAPARTGPCHVFSVEGDQADVKQLRANCRGRGFVLGSATEFSVVTNDALQATLVDARLGGERRVILLSFQDDGQPLVEDLSGEIALAAGRGPMSPLAGVDIDVATFASGGSIGVHGRSEDRGSAKADGIGIGQHIALERARRGGGAAQQ